MAKNEKKNGMMEVTDESVMDQIKNANKFSEDIVKTADEIKDKEERERRARELNEIRDRATYYNLKSVLQTRLINKHKRATDAFREKTRDLLSDVISGKLTATEYTEAIAKAVSETNSVISEGQKDYNTGIQELRNKFPNGNWYEWDNYFNNLSKPCFR